MELLIVLIIVALSAFYLIRRFRTSVNKKSKPGSACICDDCAIEGECDSKDND